MPQIAQQDYKVIAPKPGRSFNVDAAALGEIKKAILNGIGFDCLIKNAGIADEGTLDRILGFYGGGSLVKYYDSGDGEIKGVDLTYTVTQYQGLAAVQNAEDELLGEAVQSLPTLGTTKSHLVETGEEFPIYVDGKYLTPTASGGKLTALAVAETGPGEFAHINITWEDAQKLIGLPLV